MKQKAQKRARPTQSIRIISGLWRRRSLPVIDADGCRPTGDRIRETLFNWLAPYVSGARALDLFAGTGALGLEALSRSAEHVHFLENNTKVATQLNENLTNLKADPTRFDLHRTDALPWLTSYDGMPFDLVFIDPPFTKAYWDTCCSALNTGARLSPEALIYVESPRETKLNIPANWEIHRSLKAGAVLAQLFKVRFK